MLHALATGAISYVEWFRSESAPDHGLLLAIIDEDRGESRNFCHGIHPQGG